MRQAKIHRRRKKSRKPAKIKHSLNCKSFKEMFSIQLNFNGGNWGAMYVCSKTSAMWATTQVMPSAGSDVTFTPAVRIWWDLGSYFKLTHKSFSTRGEKQPVCLA